MLYEDSDGDGFDAPADCDDGDAAAYPDAPEVPYDGVDQDCDGADLSDQDADGAAATEAGGDDCDDSDPSVAPGLSEICDDRIDQDCDGATDEGCTATVEAPAPGGIWWACSVAPAHPGGGLAALPAVALALLFARRRVS